MAVDPKDWLKRWIGSYILAEGRDEGDYDVVMMDLLADSAEIGISRGELEEAAGGNVRARVRKVLKTGKDNA